MVLIFYHDQYLNFSMVTFKSTFFQEVLKILKLKPLFLKKGCFTDHQKYRPISLLFLLSKTIEKIVYDHTEEFLRKTKILYRFQSDFWKNCSTNTCLGHLTDKITTEFEKALFTWIILIDLQKQFGTIDYQISLKKTKYLAFSKNTIAWFKSYLHEQKFKISISNIYLSWKD